MIQSARKNPICNNRTTFLSIFVSTVVLGVCLLAFTGCPPAVLDDHTAFTLFLFAAGDNAALSADYVGTISGTTITVVLPAGTDVTALKATAVWSPGSVCSPDPEAAMDFTSPVSFTLTAEDEVTTAAYTVTVVMDTAPANVTDLTASAGDGNVTLLWTEPSDADYDYAEITSSPSAFNPLRVNKGITSVIIGSLTNEQAYTFTVKSVDAADNKSEGATAAATPTTAYPTVSSTSPAAGAAGVSRSSSITVTFSAAMNGDTIDEESVVLKLGGQVIPSNVTYASRNATIAPVSELAANTLYVLSIKSTVMSSGGLPLKNGYSMSFTTTSSGTWSSAEYVEDLFLFDCRTPRAAFDSQGRGLCVFRYNNNRVYAVRYTAAGWGSPERIDTIGGNLDNSAPVVAMDDDGNALALWRQDDGNNYRIYWSRFSAGTGAWSGAAILDEDTSSGNDAGVPAIAFDSDGNAVAIWAQEDGTRNNLLSKAYTAGGTWGSLLNVESTDNDVDYDYYWSTRYTPRIAWNGLTGANSKFIALWVQHTAADGERTHYGIYSGATWATAGWGAEARLSASTGGTQDYYPDIACDSSGNAVAVWRDQNETTACARFFDGSSWGSQTELDTINGSVAWANVSFFPNGDCVAVWTQHDGTKNRVYANRRSAGASGSWAGAVRIDTGSDFDSAGPRVIANSAGGAVAVWDKKNGFTADTEDAWACVMNGSTWGSPVLVEKLDGDIDMASQDGWNPDIALIPNGNVVAIWHQTDGNKYSIFYSVYSR